MAFETQITESRDELQTVDVSKKESSCDKETSPALEYGLPLKEVYKLAHNFYKEKEGKAVHFSYEDKLQLVAFSQQVLHGPFSEAEAKLPPLGALDVVGKNRRLHWSKLGNLSTEQAQFGFVELLSRKCALFSAYVEAHRRDKQEQERRKQEQDRLDEFKREEVIRLGKLEKIEEEKRRKEEQIKRQIQQALNEQTYDQFRKYAEHQFPGDPEKQGVLVRELQEQHYVQYMKQLQIMQQQKRAEDTATNQRDTIISRAEHNSQTQESHNASTFTTPTNVHEKSDDSTAIVDAVAHIAEENVKECNSTCMNLISKQQATTKDTNEEEEMRAAKMWTRGGVEEFKLSVAQAEGDCVVRIGHGETLTVRVPTHPQGNQVVWEFATDDYDVGFGVFFEYGVPITNEVSVHLSESDDEEDIEDDENDDDVVVNDLNQLEAARSSTFMQEHHLFTEIVPVYRRDSHLEVYLGSHRFPGQGCYLLKFDNSYSLWRSKTLYYRVYYTH